MISGPMAAAYRRSIRVFITPRASQASGGERSRPNRQAIDSAVAGGNPIVEVVLLSQNDPDTGLRVMKTIEHYRLQITRAISAPPGVTVISAVYCRGSSFALTARRLLGSNHRDAMMM